MTAAAVLNDAAAYPPSGPHSPVEPHAVAGARRRAGSAPHGPHSGPGRGRRRRPYQKLTEVGKWHARTHAARPVAGRFVCPQLAEVTIPAGYRPVLDRAEAAVLVDELPEATAALREDSRATRRAVWAALVEHLHPETGLIIASHAQLGERASVHRGRRVPRSTVGDHVRALVDAGLLHVAQYGASAQALSAERDRAPTYIVLAPQLDEPAEVDEPLTPEQRAEVVWLGAQLDAMTAGTVDELRHLPKRSTPTRVEVITKPRKRPSFSSSEPIPRHETAHTSPHTVLGRSPYERPGPARREQPDCFAARTGPEREIAAAWISAAMGWAGQSRFAALIDKELLKITGPFFAAGWSPRAVIRAWEIQPDGTPWPGPLPTPDQRDSRDQPRIRRLPALLTARLKAWRDPLGHPLDPPIPTKKPPRGRPRKPPAPRPSLPPRQRSAPAEAELAAFRARDNQRRAARAAEQAQREARRSVSWRPPAGEADRPADQLPAVHLRAQVDRTGRRGYPAS